MKIELRKVFVENITYFWKNKTIFGKERPWETLSVHTHMRTHTKAMRTHAYCNYKYANFKMIFYY